MQPNGKVYNLSMKEFNYRLRNVEKEFIFKYNDKLKIYYKNNQPHREDGPAETIPENFYLNGIKITKIKFAEKTNQILCICGDFCNQECFINDNYELKEIKIFKSFGIFLNHPLDPIC